MKTKAKLTMVSINGKTVFVHLPTDENGKVNIKWDAYKGLFGIKPDQCIFTAPGANPFKRLHEYMNGHICLGIFFAFSAIWHTICNI